jgi:diguanylate cyclase (GGDEF)-like protein
VGDRDDEHLPRLRSLLQHLETLRVLRDLHGNVEQPEPETTHEAVRRLEDTVGLLVAQVRFQERSFATTLRQLMAQQSSAEPAASHSWRDTTTGLWTREYVHDILPIEFERAQRYGHPLTCLMSTVECNQGHPAEPANDAVAGLLRDLTDVLRATLRVCDVCCRWSDYAALVILPNTSLEGTITATRRLQDAAANLGKQRGIDSGVTVSVGGFTMVRGNARDADELLAKAQAALEEARSDARDHVCLRGGYRWDLANEKDVGWIDPHR